MENNNKLTNAINLYVHLVNDGGIEVVKPTTNYISRLHVNSSLQGAIQRKFLNVFFKALKSKSLERIVYYNCLSVAAFVKPIFQEDIDDFVCMGIKLDDTVIVYNLENLEVLNRWYDEVFEMMQPIAQIMNSNNTQGVFEIYKKWAERIDFSTLSGAE